MPGSDLDDVRDIDFREMEVSGEYQDVPIECIDCAEEFIWTAGEQQFFYDKHLLNPPKRCKQCKKAKNRRLEQSELAKITGKRHRIEVKSTMRDVLDRDHCSVLSSQGVLFIAAIVS
jgi:hypothetical protein